MFEAILLAVIQGLTEFLPVSSSGHLTLTQHVLPSISEPDLLLDVWLHVGTLLATIVAFRSDLWGLTQGLLQRDPKKLRYIGLLIAGSIPTAAIGLGFKDALEAAFADPQWVGIDLLFTSGLLALGAYIVSKDKETRELTLWIALFIGLAQGIAILPGVSRSGSTVVAAIVCGIARSEAARFSFLLSIPAIAGATVLQTKDAIESGAHVDIASIAVGAIVAFFVGYAALQGFLVLLRKGQLMPFSIYTAILGVTALVLL